jgi:hypothetical protein
LLQRAAGLPKHTAALHLALCADLAALSLPVSLPVQFAVWMKQNIVAGRPVIGGFRVSGGGYEDYDHIM